MAAAAKFPKAKFLGIDWDQASLEKLKQKLVQDGLGKIKLAAGNYSKLKPIAQDSGFDKADAILLDLGLSSIQLDDPSRGFSFQRKGPLDMRFDRSAGITAADILNTYPETKLTEIFYKYGEDSFSKKIAHNIVRERALSPITGTDQVFRLIEKALPKPVRHRANDSARRIFQALRIEVNHELDNLAEFLPQALEFLNPGGRLLIISFHSLEDRMVKRFFLEKSKGCVCPKEFPICVCGKTSEMRIITRKPVTAGESEQNINPRSKPAKLRVAEKVTNKH